MDFLAGSRPFTDLALDVSRTLGVSAGDRTSYLGLTIIPIKRHGRCFFNGSPLPTPDATHLNTPRRISRPADNVIVWRWDSEPFGTATANQDPDGDGIAFVYNPRFPGQYYDVETGLNYNSFRDYDPATGRYVESGPIGLNGGIDTYAYVRGNPMSRIDLLGLCDDEKARCKQVKNDAIATCAELP